MYLEIGAIEISLDSIELFRRISSTVLLREYYRRPEHVSVLSYTPQISICKYWVSRFYSIIPVDKARSLVVNARRVMTT